MLLALLLFASGTSVSAHALLVKADPRPGVVLEQPPEQVVAWFSQELETDFSTMQVYGTDGSQVDKGDGGVDLFDPNHASMVVTLPDTLADGTYTVRWTVVSADDGDSTNGEFTFNIGEAGTGQGQKVPNKSSVNDEQTWPVGQMMLSSAVLLVVIIAVVIIPRINQND